MYPHILIDIEPGGRPEHSVAFALASLNASVPVVSFRLLLVDLRAGRPEAVDAISQAHKPKSELVGS